MSILISPSSILPAISGIANYPSGYKTVEDKLLLLANGSGLFTGNYADFHQERNYNPTFLLTPDGKNILGTRLQGFEGKGINQYYTSPDSYTFGNKADGTLYGQSGIFITYPPSGDPENHPSYSTYLGSTGRGIFNFHELLTTFSNAKLSKDLTGAAGIDSFTIFNDYIHYLPFGEDEGEGGETTGPSPQPGGGTGPAAQGGREVAIPFVADLVPTKSSWDRYGSDPGYLEDYVHHESDPDYSDSEGEGNGED